jgi:hypothetical protein
MKTRAVIAMAFILVLRLAPGAAGGELDSVYSHFYTMRLEADSGKLFFYKCTLTIVYQSDTGKVRLNYYAKRLIDPAQILFLVNRGADSFYARPAVDTIFITYKQAGFLTIETRGDGMRFAFGKEMLAIPESTENVYLMQPGQDTIIVSSHIIKIPNDEFYEEGLIKWLPAAPIAAITEFRTMSISRPARGAGGTVDVLGRALPASRQGARIITIERNGTRGRELQPAW